jgi:uncharacterized protein
MDIQHDKVNHRVYTVVEGLTAYVEYVTDNETFDIIHTIVPPALEGRGIASALVGYAHDFALGAHLKLSATCSYAQAWLKRHPDYQQ